MSRPDRSAWPEIPYDAWSETCKTLHRWTQVVGKVRMECMPWINHSWGVTQYVSARGLTTSPFPYGAESVEIEFDFIDHRLEIRRSDGARRSLSLEPMSVADFYTRCFETLDEMGVDVTIDPKPNEVEDATPFPEDREHAAYDAEGAYRFWRALVQVDRVFTEFRARFIGKCSPVHFFWGSFDLAVTRFSGRTAPPHPGGFPNLPEAIAREAYSHEVSSAGLWPGADVYPEPIFYSYVYPEPDGFGEAPVGPDAAFYSEDLGEWVLPYSAVRESEDPDATLLEFLQASYAAAADLAGWDREGLERPSGFTPSDEFD